MSAMGLERPFAAKLNERTTLLHKYLKADRPLTAQSTQLHRMVRGKGDFLTTSFKNLRYKS
jgi:hypothetical protein